MIEKITQSLTNKIRKKMPEVDDERAEVINYGLQILLGEIPKIFIMFGIAYLLGILKLTLLTFIILMPYRGFSGGFHLKTHLGCILGTSMFYCGIAYISKFSLFSYNIKYVLTILIWIFGILMCRLYAPADTENVPILRKKERKTKRILSYIVLTITLIIGAVIKNNTISNIIILGMLVQSIMISKLAYRITNNKYGYEVYN